MTAFQDASSMQHLRQIFSIIFLVGLLGGCSETRRWNNDTRRCDAGRCTETIQCKKEIPPIPQQAEPELAAAEYKPLIYRLDNRRTLEIWDCEANGHFTFCHDGKPIRTERLLYCSASPMISNDEPIQGSPAVHLNGTKSRFVIVCQQGDDHYLYTVVKVASGFPKVGRFISTTPLELIKVGNAYRFSGDDYLPGNGAQQFSPHVIFKFVRGKLRLDRQSMRKRLPTQLELHHIQHYIRQKFKEPNDIPAELFDTVFAFYYCGEVKEAKQFFNSVYPKKLGQKAYWWQFIKEQIAQSPYREQIEH